MSAGQGKILDRWLPPVGEVDTPGGQLVAAIFHNYHRVGRRQMIVMKRARASSYGYVMCAGFLEARACRRLVERGLMISHNHGVSYGAFFQLTDEGKRRWLWGIW